MTPSSYLAIVVIFIATEAVYSQDCFKWGTKLDNKATFLEVNQKCGITGKTCVRDKGKVECVFKAVGMMKNDGTVNIEKVGKSLQESVTPQKEKAMMSLVSKCATDSSKIKDFPSCFARGLPSICTHDRVFSKLGNC